MSAVTDTLIDLLPSIIRFVEKELDAGRDPKKQLEAAMDAADVAVDALEDAKFGPRR